LGKHTGTLTLGGLETLSGEVAEALAKKKGWLRLDGLAGACRDA
jgi:hypothetical protein